MYTNDEIMDELKKHGLAYGGLQNEFKEFKGTVKREFTELKTDVTELKTQTLTNCKKLDKLQKDVKKLDKLQKDVTNINKNVTVIKKRLVGTIVKLKA